MFTKREKREWGSVGGMDEKVARERREGEQNGRVEERMHGARCREERSRARKKMG